MTSKRNILGAQPCEYPLTCAHYVQIPELRSIPKVRRPIPAADHLSLFTVFATPCSFSYVFVKEFPPFPSKEVQFPSLRSTSAYRVRNSNRFDSIHLTNLFCFPTRKRCCRKETTRCRSCSFPFKIRRRHSLQV